MRIISGTHKGRKITAPKNLPVRPTTDMAKEGLFNILNNRYFFDDISILDLFAGIGSISFEFASRGTTKVTSVDKHYGCVKFIVDTAAELDLPIQTVKSDAYKYLEQLREQYTIVFADPPYDFTQQRFADLATTVLEKDILEKNGILIIEHSKHTDLSHVKFFKSARNYGGSVFSFFSKD